MYNIIAIIYTIYKIAIISATDISEIGNILCIYPELFIIGTELLGHQKLHEHCCFKQAVKDLTNAKV